MKDGYSIGGFDGSKNDDELFFYIQTYFFPPVVYRMDLKTYKYELLETTETTYDVKEYTIEIKEYVSKDNVKIPITLVYKKGIKLDGSNPTLLESYGGFGISESAHFDPALVYFLSQGGVFAYAHVRGEGTFGLNWANEGKRLKKQNTINDFIAAAEYLIKEKYTSANHLAITGGSHGGLLVGAAMVQRPDLFKIVIPVVGVFDMLRFEKFTVGVFHINEFGTIKKEEDFRNILSYSPIHNIKAGVNYPTTLVMTSDNDERVPPFNSYKFVAQLQKNLGQKNPIFLRVEKQAGHYGGGTLDEKADFYGLLLNVLK
jgi:prolyl oligopeptidase